MQIVNYFIKSGSSLVWGILIGLGLTVLLLLCINQLQRGRQFSILSWGMAGVTAILMMFQCTLLTGTYTVKSYVGEVQDYVDEIGAKVHSNTGTTAEDVTRAVDELERRVPFIGKYINTTELRNCNPEELGTCLIQPVQKKLDRYILRRVGWIALFIIIGIIAIRQTGYYDDDYLDSLSGGDSSSGDLQF